jgi:hypothetical protein
MKAVADLLNAMIDAGVIDTYALFGATAQMRYTEAVATLDADVLVVLRSEQGLDLLAPIYEFCRTRGYVPQDEAVLVGAWPVQLVPVFSTLTKEAVELAETVDYEGSALRVVRATHLAVIALSVGRAKDCARILALLESKSVAPEEIETLAARHQLSEAWQRFKRRFLDE